MRTAVLGGSFNPVHIGHLFLAEEVKRSLGYDRVVFVPANVPAHKGASECIPGKQRLAMLERALAGVPYFALDDCELQRGGVSYTIDSIPQIAAHFPSVGKLGLIVGDDLVEGFERWKSAAELASLVEIILARRSTREPAPFPYPHHHLENLLLPISSTDIRRRISGNQAYRHIVPEAVYEYIETQGLYR